MLPRALDGGTGEGLVQGAEQVGGERQGQGVEPEIAGADAAAVDAELEARLGEGADGVEPERHPAAERLAREPARPRQIIGHHLDPALEPVLVQPRLDPAAGGDDAALQRQPIEAELAGCALAGGELELEPLAEHGGDILGHGARLGHDVERQIERRVLGIGERQIGIGGDQPLDGER